MFARGSQWADKSVSQEFSLENAPARLGEAAAFPRRVAPVH